MAWYLSSHDLIPHFYWLLLIWLITRTFGYLASRHLMIIVCTAMDYYVMNAITITITMVLINKFSLSKVYKPPLAELKDVKSHRSAPLSEGGRAWIFYQSQDRTLILVSCPAMKWFQSATISENTLLVRRKVSSLRKHHQRAFCSTLFWSKFPTCEDAVRKVLRCRLKWDKPEWAGMHISAFLSLTDLRTRLGWEQ